MTTVPKFPFTERIFSLDSHSGLLLTKHYYTYYLLTTYGYGHYSRNSQRWSLPSSLEYNTKIGFTTVHTLQIFTCIMYPLLNQDIYVNK